MPDQGLDRSAARPARSAALVFLLLACLGCVEGAPQPAPPPQTNPPLRAAGAARKPAARTAREKPGREAARATPSGSPAAGRAGAEAGPAPTAASDRSVERFVLFTPGGPLVVELEMTIDARPFRAAREGLVAEFLVAADRNKDGKPTWAEVLDSPPSIFGQFFRSGRAPHQRKEFTRTNDTNRNGLVDEDEAGRFVARANDAGASFTLDDAAEYRGSDQHQSVVRRLLDADADGELSTAELAAVAQRLKSRDADDDDLVEWRELAESAPADELPAMRPAASTSPAPRAAMALGWSASWDGILSAFDELYLGGGRVDEESFPLVPGLVGELDADGDGWLGPDEIRRLNGCRPHIELEANFGQTGSRPPGLSLRSIAAELGDARQLVSQSGGGVTIELAGVVLRFRSLDVSSAEDGVTAAQSRLAVLDTDKNGYLDQKEFSAGPAESASFEAWDADGDGKVYAEEMAAYNRRQQAPRLSAIRVAIGDEPDALFALLDSDSDARLSQRELARAAERLGELDRDGNGRLLLAEIPACTSVDLSRGATPPSGLAPAGSNAASPPAPALGPGWFVAMDANHDGDVSPREFLGSAETFRWLDRDADGFVEPGEALAAAEELTRTSAP